MAAYEQWWFWMIFIGIIVIIAAFIVWAFTRKLDWWFWFLLILGGIILLLGIIWWAFSSPEEPVQMVAPVRAVAPVSSCAQPVMVQPPPMQEVMVPQPHKEVMVPQPPRRVLVPQPPRRVLVPQPPQSIAVSQPVVMTPQQMVYPQAAYVQSTGGTHTVTTGGGPGSPTHSTTFADPISSQTVVRHSPTSQTRVQHPPATQTVLAHPPASQTVITHPIGQQVAGGQQVTAGGQTVRVGPSGQAMTTGLSSPMLYPAGVPLVPGQVSMQTL